MRCRPTRTEPAQRGAALVVALLVFAIVATLLVAMQREFTLTVRRGANLFLGEQGYQYLLGAEALASQALLLDARQDALRDDPRDDLREIWAAEAPTYPLEEGGALRGQLEDLQARFNINALTAQSVTEEGERRFTPAQQQFVRLLLTIEEPRLTPSDAEALTDAIGDWLDEDGNPRPRGAEDDAYYVRSPTHRVGNGPMASITELRKVLGMTPELYEVLAPLITVWPSEWQPLNIHTASMPLLRTIRIDDSLEPLSLSVATQLLQQREETGFGSAEEFLQQPLFGEGDSAEALTLIGETSSWFLLTAQVEIADRQMHLYSVLQRDGTSVRPLLRSRGAL